MKDERIYIRLTKEEKKEIERGAKKLGMNLSTFMRYCALVSAGNH